MDHVIRFPQHCANLRTTQCRINSARLRLPDNPPSLIKGSGNAAEVIVERTQIGLNAVLPAKPVSDEAVGVKTKIRSKRIRNGRVSKRGHAPLLVQHANSVSTDRAIPDGPAQRA